MLEFIRSSELVNPRPAGLSTYQQSTADQLQVLEPGSYTLEIVGPANETTIFRASKFPFVPSSTATVGTAQTVSITKEKVHWVRLDGAIGQSINVSPPPKWILDADGVVQPQLPNPNRAPHIPRYGNLTFGSKPTYWIGYTADRDLTTDMIAHSVQPPTALPSATTVTPGSKVTGQLTPATTQIDYEFRLDSWQWVTVTGNQNSLQWRLQSAGGAGWTEQDTTMPGRIPFLNQAILLAPGSHRLSVQQMFMPRTVDFEFTLNTRPYAGSAYLTDTVVSQYAPLDQVLEAAPASAPARFLSSWQRPMQALCTNRKPKTPTSSVVLTAFNCPSAI